MSWNVARTPPASGNMMTAGHGPLPSGVCRLAPKVPSGVVIDTSRCGIRDLLELDCLDVGIGAAPPTTGALERLPTRRRMVVRQGVRDGSPSGGSPRSAIGTAMAEPTWRRAFG